ncbi:MAG: hypothetical protein ACPGPC_11870 [Alphaproteobacteria bacterium]
MNRTFKLLLATLAITLSVGQVTPSYAVDELTIGPKVGTALPHALKAQDQNSQYRDFKSLARKRGLIVMFSRSLDW